MALDDDEVRDSIRRIIRKNAWSPKKEAMLFAIAVFVIIALMVTLALLAP
jgi:hypothetical protein